MRIFTDEWALAYRDAINAHPSFREAAADWQLGPIGVITRADGDDQEDAAFYLKLEKGECRYVANLSPKDV